MSGAQTYAGPNVLFDPLMASRQSSAENQLLKQQQEIGANDIAMVGQAAAPLLGMSEEDAAREYPRVIQGLQGMGYAKQAPATYPGHAATQALVQRAMPLIDQFKTGYITTPEQKAFIDRVWPGSTPPTAAATAGGGPAAPATSGTVEPDALARAQAVRDGLIKRGLDVDTATGFAANALHESGANPNVGAGDAGASHGAFQWTADRYNRYIAINGHPPDNAPLNEQLDFVVHELGTTEGAARDRIAAAQGPAGKAAAISQYYLRPKDVQPEIARRSATATQLASQWGSAGTSTAAPVIAGDSLASQGGLGGSGVVDASPKAVLDAVRTDSRSGKYSGQPVVLSTGASNDPTDLASVEQQIREAQGGNAGRITVLGVGPAVEAKAPGTNAKLQALSKSYGADFVPLPADQMSPDGVHPTAQGYATLKAAIAPAQGAPGSGGAGGRYQIAGQPVAGPGGPGGQPQPPAQIPQPPANRAMPGSADGPPAPQQPQPAPAGGPQPPTSTPAPPSASSGIGVNSPQYQQAQQYLRQAAAARMMPGYAVSPQLQATAAWLQQQGESMMKLETFRDLGGGMQQNVLTGEFKYGGPPTARSTTDNDGNTWILAPGQPPKLLHANVSGVTGTGPEASAQRTVQEIGPKVANGTATPQEQANYATAVEVYRGASIEHDPNTNGLVRVYKRDLPPGFPPSPFTADGGGTAQPLTKGMTPSQKSAEEELGKGFATTDKKSYDASSASLGMLTAMNNDAEILNRTPGGWAATGTGANTKLELGKALNTVSGFFGGKPFVDPAQISAWESLNKQTKLMGMQVVNSYFGGSREAASIINGATGAVPGSENSYLGFRLVSSGIEQDLLRQRELYEFKAQRLQDGKPLITAEADFNKAHPVETYTARAIANAVPDDMVARLMATPNAETIQAFDKHFGPGIGEFIVRGGRSGMGRAGVPSNG